MHIQDGYMCRQNQAFYSSTMTQHRVLILSDSYCLSVLATILPCIWSVKWMDYMNTISWLTVS